MREKTFEERVEFVELTEGAWEKGGAWCAGKLINWEMAKTPEEELKLIVHHPTPEQLDELRAILGG